MYLRLFCVLWLTGCSQENLLVPRQTQLVVAQSLDFGAPYVGGFSERTLLLAGSGTGDVQVTALEVSHVEVTAALALPVQVRAHQTLVVRLRWTPSAVGTLSGWIAIESSAGVHMVTLTGEAQAPSPCDDGNECTTDTFAPTTGQCEHTARAGSCDDGSACTQDGLCVDTVCQGVAVVCNDGDRCTLDACDAALGCVALPDATQCDDGNPCTADLCTPTGCESAPVPDMTLCPGQRLTCSGWPVCIMGACEVLETPDGFPCDDGSFCTTSDVCEGGQCVGTAPTEDPHVLGAAHSFGVTHTTGLALSSERLLLMTGDWEYANLVGQLSSVRVVEGALVLEDSLVVPFRPYQSVRLSASLAVLVQEESPLRLHVVAIDSAGGISFVAQLASPGPLGRLFTYQSVVYSRRSNEDLTDIFDFGDPLNPVHVGTVANLGHWLLGGMTPEWPWVWSMLDGTLVKVSLSDPLAPQVVATVSLPGGATVYGAQHGNRLIVHANYVAATETSAACDTYVLDADSGAILGAPNLPCDFFLGATPHGVLQQQSETVVLLDLSNPATPLVRDSVAFVTDSSFSINGGINDLRVFSGRSSASAGVSEPISLILRVTSAGLESLTGSAHGNVGLLVPSDSGALSLAPDAVLQLDLQDPTAPAFVRGARALPGVPVLLNLNLDGVAQHRRVGWHGGFSLASDLPRYYVSTPEAPEPQGFTSLTSLHCPQASRQELASDGRFLYATPNGYCADRRLEIFDLRATPPTLVGSLPFTGAVHASTFDPGLLQLALILSAGGDPSQRLVVIDVSQPHTPAYLTDVPFLPPSNLSVMEMYLRQGRLAWRDGGSRLRVAQLTAEGLLEEAAPLYVNGRLLDFDGRLALMGLYGRTNGTFLSRLYYYDTQGPELTPVHTVELPLPVRAAASLGPYLGAHWKGGVSLVQPPCPPSSSLP